MRTRALLPALLFGLALPAVGPSARGQATPAQATPAPRPPAADPDSALLHTEDVAHFWEAMDKAAPDSLEEYLQRYYLDRGSAGVAAFTPYRIGSARELAATVRRNLPYYRSVRTQTLAAADQMPRIRAAFYALKHLYPAAVFPDVYFLVGRLNSGGTSTPEGLMIGVEMKVNRPDSLPYLVAHELIHFQQKGVAKDLLGQAFLEGSADFIGELISGGLINTDQHAFARGREAEIWRRFMAERHGTDASAWLYDAATAGTRHWPKDMGYWVGYEIAKGYYVAAPDKRAAVRELLLATDFEQVLRRSGVGGK